MKVVIAGVGSDRGFTAACKAMEHRHKVYGVDSRDLNGLRFQELVREAPDCYFKQADLSNELVALWEIGKLYPDMVIDATTDPAESAVIKNICTQKKWDYHR